MFKYLILCLSWMLALPSYAVVIDPGNWAQACEPDTTLYGITNSRREAGKLTINVTGIKLTAGVDNLGVTATGPRFDCHNLTGFTLSALTKHHLGFVQSNPALTWRDSEYFNIGNGLAMKLMVGDNNLSQVPLTKSPPTTITFPEVQANRNPETLGVAVQATLKVVGDVQPTSVPISVRIGTFEYRMWNVLSTLGTTAFAPIIFNISVQQASLDSCVLGNANSVFPLLAVGKSSLDSPGTELQGGEITVGPVVCPAGLDVKVNFFDNATAANGLTDYLRTVYSDDSTPSKYALKFYPVGGGDPLKFLPRTQLQEGFGPATNDTTVNFTQSPTSAASSVQKNYTVKYIKTTNAGSDRPGPIKGIMTVQFLYY